MALVVIVSTAVRSQESPTPSVSQPDSHGLASGVSNAADRGLSASSINDLSPQSARRRTLEAPVTIVSKDQEGLPKEIVHYVPDFGPHRIKRPVPISPSLSTRKIEHL